MKRIFAWVWLTCILAGTAAAQQYDAEQQAEIDRQERFRNGVEAIVADFNNNSLLGLNRAIDHDTMMQRIVDLRLIDRRVRSRFEEDFETDLPNMLERSFRLDDDSLPPARLLNVASSGFVGRATVRYDLPDFQFRYHEYELRLDDDGDLRIVDWVDFVRGQAFSEAVGETLIAAAPSKPAVRKLIDAPRITDAQVFQLTELLKATRDRSVERFMEIFAGLDQTVRSQRVTVLAHAHLMTDARKRRNLRTALVEMDRYFPEEPLFSIMLLDLYFPTRQFDKALAALERLERRLGVEDAGMQARLSAASLVRGDLERAQTYAARAVELEPGLELGWWSTLRAAVVAEDWSGAVTALDRLTGEFGHSLNEEALSRDPAFRGLLASDAFRAWSAKAP